VHLRGIVSRLSSLSIHRSLVRAPLSGATRSAKPGVFWSTCHFRCVCDTNNADFWQGV
jgi:hypothetical protein